MPKFTAVVVGAGLAGLSAAYSLAKDGIDVVVVDRGDYPGAKNVTGGRMYFLPIRNLFPELWAEAPWERHVAKEIITIVGEHSSTSIGFRNEKYNEEPYHSFTILRSKFDKWFSQKVTEKGARIISKYKVDDLILEDGKVQGIIVGGAGINADVVIAADGVMSQVAEKAGLRGKRHPEEFALGVKEVIELTPEAVESRFGLGDGEGVAQLFAGTLTKGMFGAGFLYTNHSSISLGVIASIRDLAQCQPQVTPYELLEEFIRRPEVAPLLKDGESVEYSAHIVPEKGMKGMPKLFGDGILVVGDAAGMALNLGLTVRGMEFAIASGAMAAETVKIAKRGNDYSASTLSKYQDLLKESFVWKDLNTFKHAPDFLDNPRFFNRYPQFACDIMENLMGMGEGGKEKLSSTALKQLSSGLVFSMIRDAIGLRRI